MDATWIQLWEISGHGMSAREIERAIRFSDCLDAVRLTCMRSAATLRLAALLGGLLFSGTASAYVESVITSEAEPEVAGEEIAECIPLMQSCGFRKSVTRALNRRIRTAEQQTVGHHQRVANGLSALRVRNALLSRMQC